MEETAQRIEAALDEARAHDRDIDVYCWRRYVSPDTKTSKAQVPPPTTYDALVAINRGRATAIVIPTVKPDISAMTVASAASWEYVPDS